MHGPDSTADAGEDQLLRNLLRPVGLSVGTFVRYLGYSTLEDLLTAKPAELAERVTQCGFTAVNLAAREFLSFLYPRALEGIPRYDPFSFYLSEESIAEREHANRLTQKPTDSGAIVHGHFATLSRSGIDCIGRSKGSGWDVFAFRRVHYPFNSTTPSGQVLILAATRNASGSPQYSCVRRRDKTHDTVAEEIATKIIRSTFPRNLDVILIATHGKDGYIQLSPADGSKNLGSRALQLTEPFDESTGEALPLDTNAIQGALTDFAKAVDLALAEKAVKSRRKAG